MTITTTKALSQRPPLQHRMSVARGNAVQFAGITAGGALIAASAVSSTAPTLRLGLSLIGWLLIYDCTHAIGHYLIGRSVGIQFRGYGIRGTDHPEDYPAGIRHLMSWAPFWTVLTDKRTMTTAAPWRKALMFAAGETSTAACSIASAACAAAANIPGGRTLLWFAIVWNAVSTVVTTVKPKGDYAKALKALGWERSVSSTDRCGRARRGPESNELRNAILGWSAVNMTAVALWAANGAGTPWFLAILLPSAIAITGWAKQGKGTASTTTR